MAQFGGELEKQHRKEEGALEKAWGKETGVGTKTGLWVWRIEQFKVVAVPKNEIGRFYSGDSYIVLNVRELPFLLPELFSSHFVPEYLPHIILTLSCEKKNDTHGCFLLDVPKEGLGCTSARHSLLARKRN